MYTPPSSLQIIALKKQLSDVIIRNNYNLQCEEALQLSRELDLLMLPIFQKQLKFYNLVTIHPL